MNDHGVDDIDYDVIGGIMHYYKWEIFGKPCRFFGLQHYFDNDNGNTRAKLCEGNFKNYIHVVDYVDQKIEEGKNTPGILDVYSENFYWSGENPEDSEVYTNKRSRLSPYDTLDLLDSRFKNCYYGNKQSEGFKLKCPQSVKNSGEVNVRFHYVDDRHKTPYYDGYFGSYLYGVKKHDVYYESIQGEFNNILNIFNGVYEIVIGLFNGVDVNPAEKYESGSFLHEFLSIFRIQQRKKNSEDRITAQFRKLKSSELGLQVFEELKRITFEEIEEIRRVLIGMAENVKNGKNINFVKKIQPLDEFGFAYDEFGRPTEPDDRTEYDMEQVEYENYDKAIVYIMSFQMDLYYLGRFFNNLINNPDKSASVITIAGAGHTANYDIIFSKMKKFNFKKLERGYLSPSIPGNYVTGNCVRIRD